MSSKVRSLWVIAAVLAVVLAWTHYRGGGYEPTTVLIAKRLIPAGTPAEPTMYARATVPRDDVTDGAIDDPTHLSGRVAVRDVVPGEQLALPDFGSG